MGANKEDLGKGGVKGAVNPETVTGPNDTIRHIKIEDLELLLLQKDFQEDAFMKEDDGSEQSPKFMLVLWKELFPENRFIFLFMTIFVRAENV